MKVSRYVFKSKPFRIIVAVMIVVVPPALALYHWSNSPVSSGTVAQDQEWQDDSFLKSFVPLTTRNFSTEIPTHWNKVNRGSSDGVELVVYSPTGQQGQIGIISKPLPIDGLSGVGDYNLRTHLTEQYSRLHDPSLPSKAVVFASTAEGYSYTAFITKGSRYASVNVSQLSNGDDTIKLLAHMLNNWQWR